MKLTPRRRQVLRALAKSDYPISPREIEGNSSLSRGWSRPMLRALSFEGYVQSAGSNFHNETCWEITTLGRSAIVAATETQC